MNRRRFQLILILAAFTLPAVLALLLQTRWFHWEPQSTRNRGELIRPVIAVGTDAQAVALLANGARWSVLVHVPAPCETACARRLALLEHIREAQGKEMDRVQMVAWSAPGAELSATWARWIPDAQLSDTLALAEGGVMLVDPLGNAMMRYRVDADPTDVRKDLAHLLRWSTVGK
jgi:hypothetical protein